jgi:hypothetical protein
MLVLESGKYGAKLSGIDLSSTNVDGEIEGIEDILFKHLVTTSDDWGVEDVYFKGLIKAADNKINPNEKKIAIQDVLDYGWKSFMDDENPGSAFEDFDFKPGKYGQGNLKSGLGGFMSKLFIIRNKLMKYSEDSATYNAMLTQNDTSLFEGTEISDTSVANDTTKIDNTNIKPIINETAKNIPISVPKDESDVTTMFDNYISGNINKEKMYSVFSTDTVNKLNIIKSSGKKDKYYTRSTTSTGKEFTLQELIDKESLRYENSVYNSNKYLSGKVQLKDLKITFRHRRNNARRILKQYKESGLTVTQFKQQYPEDYNKLVEVLI